MYYDFIILNVLYLRYNLQLIVKNKSLRRCFDHTILLKPFFLNKHSKAHSNESTSLVDLKSMYDSW